MPLEVLFALITFAFVGSVTPGPNNLMLMASGANLGIRRTMPHFLGIVFGWMLMVVLVGTGLMQVFETFPVTYEILRWFCVGYLIFLAWKIAGSGSSSAQGKSRPMTAFQAALFQWVNAKAWAMALTAISVYAPSQSLAAVLLISLICGLINLPSIFVWVVMGSKLQAYLEQGRRLQIFNYSMAALLLATLYPIVLSLG